MPMKTDEPDDPAGYVPSAGCVSAAKARRGSAPAASNPPPALSTARRVVLAVPYDFMEPSLVRLAILWQMPRPEHPQGRRPRAQSEGRPARCANHYPWLTK